jgi:hypothetical protein
MVLDLERRPPEHSLDSSSLQRKSLGPSGVVLDDLDLVCHDGRQVYRGRTALLEATRKTGNDAASFWRSASVASLFTGT